MASIERLRKCYPDLGDLERFRLAVAAVARDDLDELRAIRETAPKADYRMTAWPYAGMVDALPKCIHGVTIDILCTGYLMGQAWLSHLHGCVPGDDDDDDDDKPFTDREFARMCAHKVNALFLGLMRFFDGLGITLEDGFAQLAELERDTVRLIVAQAEDIAHNDEDFRRWLALEHLPEQTGEDPATDALQEGIERVEQRLQAEADVYAEQLRDAFDAESGVKSWDELREKYEGLD